MKLRVEISLDNADADGADQDEHTACCYLRRILLRASRSMVLAGKLMDHNGNTIGSVTLRE